MKNSEIAKIVEKVWKNKEEHADELFNEIWKTIYFITYKKINDIEEAEDLTQEIALYIYTHIDDVRSAEAFYTWMNCVIFGFYQKKLRKSSKVNFADLDAEILESKEDESHNPEIITLTREKQEYMMDVLDGLSSKQRDVILLYYYQQLPVTHISQILNCSVDAIKNRLHTARAAIKRQLNDPKKGKKYQLYSINTAILLLSAFMQEEKVVCTTGIGERIKANIKEQSAAEEILENEKKMHSKRSLTVMILIGIGILGVIGTFIFVFGKSDGQERANLEIEKAMSDKVSETDDVKEKEEQRDQPESEESDTGNPTDDGEGVPDIEENEPQEGPDSSEPADNRNSGEAADASASNSNSAGSSRASDNKTNWNVPATSNNNNTAKPVIYITNDILYYSLNDTITKEQILNDGGIRAKDGNGNLIAVNIGLMERIDTVSGGQFGLSLNATDSKGNKAEQKGILIIIR